MNSKGALVFFKHEISITIPLFSKSLGNPSKHPSIHPSMTGYNTTLPLQNLNGTLLKTYTAEKYTGGKMWFNQRKAGLPKDKWYSADLAMVSSRGDFPWWVPAVCVRFGGPGRWMFTGGPWPSRTGGGGQGLSLSGKSRVPYNIRKHQKNHISLLIIYICKNILFCSMWNKRNRENRTFPNAWL